ncbi:MAG: Holliday junction branch migration protein RuvA [Oscillospiraceae bacterium]
MIYSLKGILSLKSPNMAVIECGGVGFKCLVSASTAAQLPRLGETAFLYTYMQVREDSMELFGFFDANELTAFKLLNTVTGVGAKMALSVLSTLSIDKLITAVASEDEKALTSCSGVGKKLASRIILELHDKVFALTGTGEEYEVLKAAAPSTASRISEAAQALTSLGYTQSEAAVALGACTESMTLEDMIKTALKKLMRG